MSNVIVDIWSTGTRFELMTFRSLIFIYLGLNLFYSTVNERSIFIANMIRKQSDFKDGNLPKFITSILEKVSQEPNCSYLILPISQEEQSITVLDNDKVIK